MALWNTRVYVGTSDDSNVVSVIERVINKKFDLGSILGVSYINLYDGHVRFWRGFNYP